MHQAELLAALSIASPLLLLLLLLLLLQSGSSYIEAFLTVLKNVTKDETVQYVLALVEQMLAGALHLSAGACMACMRAVQQRWAGPGGAGAAWRARQGHG